MTTVTTDPPTVRYVVSCCYCGTPFLTFSCSLPIDGLTFAPQRCHHRGVCRGATVQPRVRRVEN